MVEFCLEEFWPLVMWRNRKLKFLSERFRSENMTKAEAESFLKTCDNQPCWNCGQKYEKIQKKCVRLDVRRLLEEVEEDGPLGFPVRLS